MACPVDLVDVSPVCVVQVSSYGCRIVREGSLLLILFPAELWQRRESVPQGPHQQPGSSRIAERSGQRATGLRWLVERLMARVLLSVCE